MKSEEKKKAILRFLKKETQVATGKIAVVIRSNQWLAEKYLEELEKQGLVKKTKVPNATYWSLK